MNVTGSSGMATSEQIGVKFVQEVIACGSCTAFYSETDVAIELGVKTPKSPIWRFTERR